MKRISVRDALDMLYNGDLYDEKGNVTSDGYKALATLDGAVLTERKKGKWVEHPVDGQYCSACNRVLWDIAITALGGLPNYCPHCGAEMEVDA